jgi:hypothetical protein
MTMIRKEFIQDAFGWGLILWLIGYVFGIVLFVLVPISVLGWIIMPIGIGITIWVLLKEVEGDSMGYYISLAVIWAAIAIVFDYLFIVLAFNPAESYYKLDVYIYYTGTFILPIIIGRKTLRTPQKPAR